MMPACICLETCLRYHGPMHNLRLTTGPVATGMAHLLEHMAFKGTARVGTRDYAAEAPLLEALDEGW